MVLAIGWLLRLWAQTAPGNADSDAFALIGGWAASGDNVYESGRWNYGPTWMYALAALDTIAGSDHFRLGLAIALAVADTVIFALLVARNFLLPACLFFLLPVSFAISGQHQQFDNVAVALGLASGYILSRSGKCNLRLELVALILLGVSLSTKHVLLLLPLWLVMSANGWRRRVLYAVVPYSIFLLALLPFWLRSPGPVADHVIGYRSSSTAPAFHLLFPDEVVWGWTNRGTLVVVYAILMLSVGLLFRKLNPFLLVLAYTVSLVTFSPAMVDQYFAIAAAGVSVFLNLGFAIWLVYTGIFLLGEPDDIAAPLITQVKTLTFPYVDQFYREQALPLLVGWTIFALYTLGQEPRVSDSKELSRNRPFQPPAVPRS